MSGASSLPQENFIWWDEFDFNVKIRQSLYLKKIFEEQTDYQKLEIYEHDLLGRILVLDDILQTTTLDEFIYSEMMAHVPILGRKQGPKAGEDFSVLVIGGGDGGVIREVLQHDFVTRVVMVELDPKVVERSNEFLGFQGNYQDQRVTLLFEDGAAFLKKESTKKMPFDAIVIDSTDPYGPGEVLFTDEFFSDIKNVLKQGGTVMRHVGIPFHQRSFLIKGWERMRRIFGNISLYRATIPTYIGGEMGFLIAHKEGQCPSEPFAEFKGRYYTPEIHRAAFVLPPWLTDLAENRIQ